jgi:hypothetical protein
MTESNSTCSGSFTAISYSLVSPLNHPSSALLKAPIALKLLPERLSALAKFLRDETIRLRYQKRSQMSLDSEQSVLNASRLLNTRMRKGREAFGPRQSGFVFVAHFMGSHNVLPCEFRLAEINEQSLRLARQSQRAPTVQSTAVSFPIVEAPLFIAVAFI